MASGRPPPGPEGRGSALPRILSRRPCRLVGGASSLRRWVGAPTTGGAEPTEPPGRSRRDLALAALGVLIPGLGLVPGVHRSHAARLSLMLHSQRSVYTRPVSALARTHIAAAVDMAGATHVGFSETTDRPKVERLSGVKRRGRDSNPRRTFWARTRFPVALLRPTRTPLRALLQYCRRVEPGGSWGNHGFPHAELGHLSARPQSTVTAAPETTSRRPPRRTPPRRRSAAR